MNASVDSIAASEATEWQKVYLDAVAVNEAAPNTVCVTEQHYERGRHLVPYRMGYCHGYRTVAEHWHASYDEHLACEDSRP